MEAMCLPPMLRRLEPANDLVESSHCRYARLVDHLRGRSIDRNIILVPGGPRAKGTGAIRSTGFRRDLADRTIFPWRRNGQGQAFAIKRGGGRATTGVDKPAAISAARRGIRSPGCG